VKKPVGMPVFLCLKFSYAISVPSKLLLFYFRSAKTIATLHIDRGSDQDQDPNIVLFFILFTQSDSKPTSSAILQYL
ncbi:hypothetical protein ACXWOF_09485, partial [Streptococcus pyogenes]